MFLLLLFLFICVPAFELYLMIQVGSEIGALNTILLIMLTGVLGAAMARSQGLELLFKIQNELSRGSLPAGALLQGLLVMLGGVLLIAPGFFTDILGLAMVMPGTRSLMAKVIRKGLAAQASRGSVHIFTNMGSYQNWQRSSRQQTTFEADYTRKDEE